MKDLSYSEGTGKYRVVTTTLKGNTCQIYKSGESTFRIKVTMLNNGGEGKLSTIFFDEFEFDCLLYAMRKWGFNFNDPDIKRV